MQRQLCIKFISKLSRNCSSQASIFPSSFLLKPANCFSHHSAAALSCSKWSNAYACNGHLGKIAEGLYANPLLGRRLLSNALLKGQSKWSNSSWFALRRKFRSFNSRHRHRGWRSIFRTITPDGVLLGLVLANVTVFVLWGAADRQFMVKNFTISVENVTSGRLHTMITSAFSHKDPWHLTSNMFGLFFFGSSIGGVFGVEYLLKLYFSGAVAGSIFYLAYHTFAARSYEGHGRDPKKILGLGASGAVNALLLLDIFLFPTQTIYMNLIIPAPAIFVGVLIIGQDLMRMYQGDRRISGSTHLGGATVAAIAWLQIRRGRIRLF